MKQKLTIGAIGISAIVGTHFGFEKAIPSPDQMDIVLKIIVQVITGILTVIRLFKKRP